MASYLLSKHYDPHEVETRWRTYWLNRQVFAARLDHPGPPYSMVIPPPNVTGSLHIGHALNNTLQDILIRWRRMQGYNTLWLPGTDHAGIATQNVVERQLLEEGFSREQLGRDAFIERVWQWKRQSGHTIIDQLQRLGASCDWSRLRFTMDEGLSKAVREVFVRLYEDGLLYRGERLINWCPRCLTALSDIEVEHESVQGTLYHIRYPFVHDPAQSLIVATTRPETLLGDTAVAVHPDDPRYKSFIGRMVHLPLTNRTIPVVGDAILVDPTFGTGTVKITPAHDFQDFEAGERHGLPRLPLFDSLARLDPACLVRAQVEETVAKRIASRPVHEARTIIVEELQARGWLVTFEDHAMAVGKCYRCKTVVEPYLSPQWFVRIQPLAVPAIEAVEQRRIRIIPEGWVNNYLGWMREIKDWCISRQIWWGHRIPAWYCRSCHAELLGPGFDDGPFPHAIPAHIQPLVARTAPTVCPACQGQEFVQDPDVLDTWFSSALWPFSTLGWPEETPELKIYYPTSTLVTGLDILFFWVARMIMMGLKFTGQVPFREVYIHALVRDAEGQKMSKSKGNVIDPLTKMSQYGTDALRFTLASMASPGRDIKLAEERIEGYRNFTNKIWNAARFILMHADGPTVDIPVFERPFPDRWILSRLHGTIRSSTQALEEYRFDHAAHILYHFTWHEYCDWYLELIKPALQHPEREEAAISRHTLFLSFEVLQRLLHPFMPFITEEIWHALPHHGETLVLASYPIAPSSWQAPAIEQAFEILELFVTTIRTGRALLGYNPAQTMTVYGTATTDRVRAILQDIRGFIEHLSRSTLILAEHGDWPDGRILHLVARDMTVGLAVEGTVDLRKVLDRIRKQMQAKDKEAARLRSRLSSPEFTAKASPEVVKESETRLALLSQELALLASSETQLAKM
ncbi:MAG: valine--tRNA ligase [Nitrospirae bacterium]|nr:MAG: valine--tRNA ligase [Nitrospirota bacterium]